VNFQFDLFIHALNFHGAALWELPRAHGVVAKASLVLLLGKEPTVRDTGSAFADVDNRPHLGPKIIASGVEKVLQRVIVGCLPYRFARRPVVVRALDACESKRHTQYCTAN
jgi:hypothetical protein